MIERQLATAVRRRFYQQPLEHAVELPQVVRPLGPAQRRHQVIVHVRRTQHVPARCRAKADELPRERRDVVASLSQRWQPNPEVHEPCGEILEKDGPLHQRLQGNVRRRHQPHVESHRPVRSHRPDLAVLDRVQQLPLHRPRRFSDLIEEQRPAIRRDEVAGPVLPRVGVRAAQVPEQVRRGKVVVQRREDHLMEDRPRAWRPLVEQMRHVALARPRLPFDQDGGVLMGCEALDRPERGQVRGMPANELRLAIGRDVT